ncbi:MAG: hypothetical protein JWQ61_1431 [Collimonas fungivorans]|uniref:hypothetical protein n=1 Tax=Collimonas fungivorans TaxID=158899 RepID=UPI0026EC3D0F|nr:hypothetical protein [Collimonas fungivorans]MDB5766617.1 hypothetical protein [Collimonas fungivorans]
MLNKNLIDARALKILLKYDVLAAGYEARGYPLNARQQEYVEKNGTSPDDVSYMKQHGLAFDSLKIGHDEAVRKSFEHYALCKKKHVTNLFLASFSSGRQDYRSGLSAYAFMQTMPDHVCKLSSADVCKICSAVEVKDRLDLTGLNQQRFKCGSMIGYKTPYEIQFFLEQHHQLEDVPPAAADFAIFNAIIDILKHADDGLKPKDAHKELKKIPGFKPTTDECQYVLEILGFCSILETEQHRGYLTHYTNPGLAPSKSHSSDWAYPVDFWTGKNGINRDALKFWFGAYKEIKI